MGWTVDHTGVNGADHTNPHLFVYFTIQDYQPGYGGYNCCGFHFVSNPYVYAGIQVPGNGTVADFEIYHSGENWWLYYDGQGFAYLPDSQFYGNMVHGLDILQSYGEVASPSDVECAQMGDGYFGFYDEPAATITDFLGVHSGNYYIEDPSPTGFFEPNFSDYNNMVTSQTSEYYGGPGQC